MWFAVYTRNRCEKAVRRALDRQGIANYLPILHTPRLHGTRSRIVECPLIPGYIFVHISFDDYLSVLQTEHVVDMVRFGADLIPIPSAEIQTLQQICSSTAHEVIVSRSRYIAGDLVQVINGPLKGISGKLVKIGGRKNLVVELKNVGHSLQIVQLEARYVQRLASALEA